MVLVGQDLAMDGGTGLDIVVFAVWPIHISYFAMVRDAESWP